MVHAKICCISSLEEARLAMEHGATALGLVSAMPSGPGVIGDDLIAEIARAVPASVATVLLTSRTKAQAIVAQYEKCRVDTLQLCDHVDFDELAALRASLPGVTLMQVVHVRGPQSVAEAQDVSVHVDALLLDSGNQSLSVKELGGTGRIHDWTVSARIVEAVQVPVFLAGGLNPQNVDEAIRSVRPFGVDVCSGLRSDGALDPIKLARYMRVVKSFD